MAMACSSKKEEVGGHSDTLNMNNFDFKEEGSVVDWKCLDIKEDQVCIPRDWKVIEAPSVQFFSHLGPVAGPELKYEFFTVSKYDTAVIGLGLDQYVQGVSRQIKLDTIEVPKEGRFQYLTFETSAPCYFGEFLTEVAGKRYFTYTMYTVTNGFLFDFTLKTKVEDKGKFYKDFRNILFNYRWGGKLLFKKNDPVVSTKIVDPNSLI
jgi:hypothetical protein